jgi:hypothetical protein
MLRFFIYNRTCTTHPPGLRSRTLDLPKRPLACSKCQLTKGNAEKERKHASDMHSRTKKHRLGILQIKKREGKIDKRAYTMAHQNIDRQRQYRHERHATREPNQMCCLQDTQNISSSSACDCFLEKKPLPKPLSSLGVAQVSGLVISSVLLLRL